MNIDNRTCEDGDTEEHRKAPIATFVYKKMSSNNIITSRLTPEYNAATFDLSAARPTAWSRK